METSKLKKFAQYARRSLIEQVGSKLAQVLKDESSERRELPNVVAKLESELKLKGKEQLIEQAAYTWFNRFCALRFMDVNQYNRIMVLSPLDGQFQPEILAEAKAGHIDDSLVNDKTREKIFGLLNGSIKSRDSQSEAYRLLIVAVCNDYHRIMPYLFERIEDYMELLMPDDLLSGNSILAYTREAMTPEACKSVECIGWLYQFYISEKKDQVFDGLKKNKKITPENIPAATQLFTPDWIVRYLVENSLGRLWMLNNPSSKVIEQMDYYIKPVEEETDFLKIRSPEEIKVCDPACGSGHMLTYAYDLLYAIYLDAEYDSVDIPELILTKNLYGIEIDERAAELAAFALSMKALKGNPNDESNNRRRFFRSPIKPNICRLESISFNDDELNEYFDFVGRDLFTQDLRTTLKEFEEADNFGSLIQPTLKNAEDVLATLEAKDVSGQLFLSEIHKRVLKVLEQVDYLSEKYQVVVANPPYMGGKGMNERLSKWGKENYSDSKADLYGMFIERNLTLAVSSGYSALITMQNWMFLSSFEKLRLSLLKSSGILNLVQIGFNSFPELNSKVAQAVAFIIKKYGVSDSGVFINVNNAPQSADKEKIFLERLDSCDWVVKNNESFKSIPGSPIAYFASEEALNAFSEGQPFKDIGNPRVGMQTANNDKYLKLWHEIDFKDFLDSTTKAPIWIKYIKGGPYRRWYGNLEYLLHYKGTSDYILQQKNATLLPIDYLQKPKGTWTDLTTGKFSARLAPSDSFHDISGHCFYPKAEDISWLLGFSNTKVFNYFLSLINSSIHFQVGDVGKVPLLSCDKKTIAINTEKLIAISKEDWDSSELSWDFSTSPLIDARDGAVCLSDAYKALLAGWSEKVKITKELESRNNEIFINAYGLDNEISSVVLDEDVTLNCNPYYRYGSKTNDEKLADRLLSDVISEFISYAVGCMFGRFSLDKPGLILASRQESLSDFLGSRLEFSFKPDDDNVIPLIDFEGDWFEDDISDRFKEFLKITFGEEKFTENLAFVEEAIGKDIKKYFVKDFYADHVKFYKKRPIYWLFSSPKGTFNALIYMHRYRPDTVSVVLNDYLREFRTKLQARKESYEQIEVSASASPKDKTDAIKAIDKINKALDEVNDYERDILYPLAGQKIEIDLDDGVKANYPKFGKALKNITGLS